MSNYVEGEKLLEIQVSLAQGFDASNVTRGKWLILNTGNSDHYAILKRGEYTRIDTTMRQKTTQWHTIIEVWQRMIDDQDSYEALLTYCDNITARLDPYRKLADTAGIVDDANLTGGSVILEVQRKSAGDLLLWWLKTELYVDWTEDTNVIYAE